MDDAGRWDEAIGSFLHSYTGDGTQIDSSRVQPGITAFLVRSFDGAALQFSFPVVVQRNLPAEIALDPAGADGAAATLIERVKGQAESVPALGPLYGKGVPGSQRYRDTIEPYTVIHSDETLASHLWKADARNFCDCEGIHVILRGAMPCPDGDGRRQVADALGGLADAVGTIVEKTPARVVDASWLASLDQKRLRRGLRERGLVAFVADGSKLARTLTHHRCFFRVAGPKTGVNIPFCCPVELDPVELGLPASGGTVTGLGIRQREVLAIAGSNAQGKSTFLEGILAGRDDHAPHDGRELVVTARGACTAESTTMGLAGADISMFFSTLPPGVSGTVRSVHGMGSGSMTMAWQVQSAIARHAPLLIIDEDRAAPNLLVKSCLQKEEITPLSEILFHDRTKMGDTALVFAACAMDTLIARADRIMVLDRHEASAIDTGEFRRMLAETLRKTADGLEK
ncbi:P-loop domain-containing protein [Methanoregula formicica]|uniref:Putative ATPase of the ABC class n=1 Tax=Methanoregula formicica (strain DSM 22288 / NBRC 105244 / SMSP) TaxID=593750 RepID=L0HHS6_METFS|nr:P-loop domain-containing protein [Methanoregula formicica]AGB03321.1 putative ATPase of the ABC class [Methanoregula formicica SMSP]